MVVQVVKEVVVMAVMAAFATKYICIISVKFRHVKYIKNAIIYI